MRHAVLFLFVLFTLAFGFSSSASAIAFSLPDGKTFSNAFADASIGGKLLDYSEISGLNDKRYNLMLFSAFGDSTQNKVFLKLNGENKLQFWANDTREGYMGRELAQNVLLADVKISSPPTTQARELSNPGFYSSPTLTGAFQAFMLDSNTEINGKLFGAGSIFVGFEDSNDFDYNDIVLAFVAAPSPTPVPAAAWLLGTGLAGLVALRRKNARV